MIDNLRSKPSGDASILIVDDDEGQRSLLASFLTTEGYDIVSASSGEKALEILSSQNIAMMISDVRMPGMSGLEVLRNARREFSTLPVLLVTAFPHIRDAVDAMKDGAINYLEKPIDLDELLEAVGQALGVKKTSRKPVLETPELPPHIIAQSPQMLEVFREAVFVASSESRILITGESGTGKEIVAELIHARSARAKGPLVKVNCAALPEALLESELFGHEKGAFTGATSRRVGRFEEARAGSILLDEIGEMSPSLQAKLLRITQDNTFYRVGSDAPRRADVRILAATNRNLEKEVEDGGFREDLFYRLNVFEIYVPPLREHPEDILPLAHHYAFFFSKQKPRFSSAVMIALNSYHWPGNIRELRNAMERAALMSRGSVILPEHLPPRIQRSMDETDSGSEGSSKGRIMEEMERKTILKTLREKDFNRTATARALGISRRALLYKIKRFREQGYNVEGD